MKTTKGTDNKTSNNKIFNDKNNVCVRWIVIGQAECCSGSTMVPAIRVTLVSSSIMKYAKGWVARKLCFTWLGDASYPEQTQRKRKFVIIAY